MIVLYSNDSNRVEYISIIITKTTKNYKFGEWNQLISSSWRFLFFSMDNYDQNGNRFNASQQRILMAQKKRNTFLGLNDSILCHLE